MSSFDEIEDEFTRIIEDAFSGIESSLFDFEEKCLRPLYKIEVNDEEVIVTVDMPCAEKQSIVLNSTEEMLEISARLRRPVSLMLGGPFQKMSEFEKYSKKIRLPVKVRPESAKAYFRNGVLLIKLPIAKEGRKISVS